MIADFEQLVACVSAFPDHFFYPAVQPGVIFRGQGLGRDDHHRNVFPLWPFPHLSQKFETVHHGHHQVQQHHCRRLGSHDVQRFTAIAGFSDCPARFLQRPRHEFAGLSVIFHHQHRACRLPLAATLQRLVQLLAIYRFGQVVHRAQRVTAGPVIDHAQHDDRDLAEIRIGLQGSQHRPAVHLRHHHVEGDRGGLQLVCQLQSLLTTQGPYDREAVFLEIATDDFAGFRIVIDDKDCCPAPGIARARCLNLGFDDCRLR